VTLGVSFHEAAQREFDGATDFYAMERLAPGATFVDAVERAVGQPASTRSRASFCGDACARRVWPAFLSRYCTPSSALGFE